MVEDIEYFGFSMQGRRNYNQDIFLAEKLPNNGFLFIVADGMGGTFGGEVASSLTVNTVFDELHEKFTKINLKNNNLKNLLGEAIKKASSVLLEKKSNEPELSGMGTTLTALLIWENKYVIGQVGDSRAYYTNGEQMSQITTDHSYIEEYKSNNDGILPEGIIKNYSHILTKALDGTNVDPDFFPIDSDYSELSEDGAFLLCSDGLINDKAATNSSLFNNYIVGSGGNDEAAKQLAYYAYHYGSSDNITVLIVSFGKFKKKKLNLKNYADPTEEKTKTTNNNIFSSLRNRYKFLVPIIVLIGLAILLFFYK